MHKGSVTDLLQITCLFIIYFLTAKFSLGFDAVSGFATSVWIPSGISLAALLLLGYKLWPGIFIGALLANVHQGAFPTTGLGIAIGNTLEALVGVFILNRFPFSRNFDNLRELNIFLFLCTPIAVSVSATFGVTSLYLGNFLEPHAIFNTWRVWWVGDLISIYVLTPLILVWSRKIDLKIKPLRLAEAAVLFMTIILVSLMVFRNIFGAEQRGSSVSYLLFLPLIWASLSFGIRGATITVFILSFLTFLSTSIGLGPFSFGVLSQRLFYSQGFIGVAAITSLILAVSDSERRRYDKRKDEFISLASHELKTPVTTLKTYIHLLQRDLKVEHKSDNLLYLNKMDTEINKLTGLINDLLDISKIYTGNLKINKQKISLLMLVNEVVDSFQSSIKTHKIIIKYPINNKNFEVYADKTRLGQVLINLISNAVKYSPSKRSIQLKIASDRDFLVVSVRDYGIGIKNENLRKLFQRYYRVNTAGGQTVPGLGMGLYFSNEIIKLHEGRMWVKSQIKKGSVFYFSLPRYKELTPNLKGTKRYIKQLRTG